MSESAIKSGYTIEWNEDNDSYDMWHKLENGQYCCISFWGDNYKNFLSVSVAFCVGKKKDIRNWMFLRTRSTTNTDLKTTGKCGLEALLWAKEAIKEFEEFIVSDYPETFIDPRDRIRMTIIGDDNRRFKVYKYGLRNSGYKETMTLDGRSLVKWLEVKNGKE